MNGVDKERLEKYFEIAQTALEEAKKSPENVDISDNTRKEILDNVQRYIDDAKTFAEQGKTLDAFAALNYAHGLLDAGVLIGIFDVENDKLFAFVKSK